MKSKAIGVAASKLAEKAPLAIRAVLGEDNRLCFKAAPLGTADEGCLTFAKDIQLVDANRATLSGATVICPAPPEAWYAPADITFLISDNPRLTFMRAVQMCFQHSEKSAGVHPTAVVEKSAVIHPGASVGAFCYVGDHCVIGEGTIIAPNVTIYSDVKIGARCRINSGTVIGADGFGYERNADGVLEKFPHLGGVLIGDDVEIGANTCIDRGSLSDTLIKDRARIDNLVHVAHNVTVGEDAAVIALSMLGGSAGIGKEAWIAPGAIIMNQISVGSKGTVGLGAVVVKDVAPGQTVMGSPAQDSAQFKATRAALARLTHG
jgi:UDP-3-O-[3-hydroxymyristoyl] glucosamine N-acyltransferase